ncbi:MAG TPA: hypothetical protein VND64_07460 [Pirellulales bacterium]|nr:hypothetical protein [Pirellulales bacterium]
MAIAKFADCRGPNIEDAVFSPDFVGDPGGALTHPASHLGIQRLFAQDVLKDRLAIRERLGINDDRLFRLSAH